MPDELKACPVLSCESLSTMLERRYSHNRECYEYQLFCNDCKWRDKHFDSEDEARVAWNALERREDVRRKALEEACKAVCVLCEEDVPAWKVYGPWYYHCDTAGHITKGCKATPIRRLMAEAGTVESENS